MYAIIKSGGKQYKVKQGDIIHVELLNQKDVKTVDFKEILLLADNDNCQVGLPLVKNCLVQGEILEEIKGPKVVAYKYKKRKNYRKKKGHRQNYSRVKITQIKEVK